MDKLKVAIYTGTVPSTTFIERLVQGLSESGVTVYLFGARRHKTFYNKNVKCFCHSGRIEKLYMLFRYSMLLYFFKRKEKHQLDKIISLQQHGNILSLKLKYYPVLYNKPDIFHLQWAKGLEDWEWVKQFGIRLVLSLRGTHISISPLANKKLAEIYKELFPQVDAFHSVSQSMVAEASPYLAQHSPIKVIYNGLQLSRFPFNSGHKNHVPFKILSVGRSHWVKGYSDSIDACNILARHGFNFTYTIVGADLAEELFFQRDQLKLNDKIIFKNKLPFDRIIDEIHSSNLLLLPSLTEGIANVVLEAMALGTPVLSTDCGGMNEVISANENGFMIPVRDPEAMASEIIRIAGLSDQDCLRICASARKRIEQYHNDALMVKEMTALYQTVVHE